MRLWAAKAERGSTWLIELIAWLARAAGRSFCRVLLHPIVLYFLLTDAVARRASREFLSAATDRPATWTDVYAHLYCFAATLLDRVYMAAGEFYRFNITIEGDALVRKAMESGKGCVLLGSHLGTFDLMMLGNKAFMGLPVNIMMRFDPRARVRRIAGIDDGQTIIRVGRPDTYLRAYEVLERGEMLAALGDRIEGSSACLDSLFFNKVASFPIGPHVLAARAGAPVVLGFGLYEGRADYRIEFLEFGPTAPEGSRGSMLQPVIDRYAALLEQAARRHPKNWFNFYPYWR